MTVTASRKSSVQQVRIREGEAVKPDQPLLSLDPADFLPRIAQSKARVEALEALIESEQLRYQSDQQALKHEQSLLEYSRASVERLNKMKKRDFSSDASLEDAQEEMSRQALLINARQLSIHDHQAREHNLRARLAEERATLELDRLDYQRSQVVASFVGYVVKVDVAAGDRVNDGQSLITLYPSGTLEYRTTIPKPYQRILQQALEKGQQLSAEAEAGAIRLTFDRFSGEASAKGIDALFLITEGRKKLRIGEHLIVSLKLPPLPNLLAIPYSALYGSDRIYRVVDGRLQSIVVSKAGKYRDGQGASTVLVSSPALKRGDEVLLTNLPNAMEGLPVESGAAPDAGSALQNEQQ